MKTKPLTFLLVISFLFSIFILTSCASRPSTKIAYSKNGTEVECNENSDNCTALKGDPRSFDQDRLYCRVFSQTGTPPPNYTSSPSDTSSKVTSHSGTITDQSSGSMYSFRGTSRTETNWNKKGMESMSNALGNLAQMLRHERQVENRFNECMNIMMGYDLVRVSNQPIKENVPEQVTYPDGRPFVRDPYPWETGYTNPPLLLTTVLL